MTISRVTLLALALTSLSLGANAGPDTHRRLPIGLQTNIRLRLPAPKVHALDRPIRTPKRTTDARLRGAVPRGTPPPAMIWSA